MTEEGQRDATIRATTPDDAEALARLYTAAFPEEDLVPLVRALLGESAARSLIAERQGEAVGHAVFTRCGIDGTAAPVALLGPLAVAPACQRQGIGTALMRAGFARLAAEGVTRILVLGDPGYYGRVGFAPERAVTPPYPLPAAWRDAWQARALDTAAPAPAGILTVPAPWRRPDLWGA